MKLLENIIRKNLLLIESEKIANLSQNITVNYEIFKTYHANIRQSRHGEENMVFNYDIINLVDDALPMISKQILNHNIRNNRDFIISRDGGDFLNLVLIPQNVDGSWHLIVKTLMLKNDFSVGANQLKIMVPSSSGKE